MLAKLSLLVNTKQMHHDHKKITKECVNYASLAERVD